MRSDLRCFGFIVGLLLLLMGILVAMGSAAGIWTPDVFVLKASGVSAGCLVSALGAVMALASRDALEDTVDDVVDLWRSSVGHVVKLGQKGILGLVGATGILITLVARMILHALTVSISSTNFMVEPVKLQVPSPTDVIIEVIIVLLLCLAGITITIIATLKRRS